MEESQQQGPEQQQQQVAKATEVVNVLKYCLTNVTSSSVNIRKELFKHKLLQVTQHEGKSYIVRACFGLPQA